MLISFTGAQSTGKTTLLNELKKNNTLSKNFTFVDEITRNIKKEGYSINESGTDWTQLRIAYSHLYNIYEKGDKILDRCFIDCYCYTIYLYKHKQVSKKTFKLIKNLFSLYVFKYNIIFYIEPEFNLISDGIRSDNEKFRNEIASIFKKVVKKLNNVAIVKLSGTVEERLNTIYKTLKEHLIEC